MCWMTSMFLMSHSLSSWGFWDGVQSLMLAVLLSIDCHQVRIGTKCWIEVLFTYSFCWEMCHVWLESAWHAVIHMETRKLCACLHHSLALVTLCFFIQAILFTHLAIVFLGSFCKPAASLVFLQVQSLRTSVETRKGPDTGLLCLFSLSFMHFVCTFHLRLIFSVSTISETLGLIPLLFLGRIKN